MAFAQFGYDDEDASDSAEETSYSYGNDESADEDEASSEANVGKAKASGDEWEGFRYEEMGLTQWEFQQIKEAGISRDKLTRIVELGVRPSEYLQKPWEKMKISEEAWLAQRSEGMEDADIDRSYRNHHGDQSYAYLSLLVPSLYQWKKGDLVINKAPLEITVKDQTFTYNGSPQGYDGSTVTNTAGKTLEFGLQGSDHLQSITLTGQETNVGEYPGELVGSNAKISSPNGSDQVDVTEDYDITYVPGKLTIARAEMTVAAVDYEDWYDGATHEGGATPSVAEGTTISYSTDGGDTWTSEAPSITDVGTVNYKVKAENPNYETSTAEGTLKVKPQPVQINAKSASKPYDGTALTESGFTISAPGLPETDTHQFTVTMTEDSTVTEVGGHLNTIATVDGVPVVAVRVVVNVASGEISTM